jgi:hypothetical protein
MLASVRSWREFRNASLDVRVAQVYISFSAGDVCGVID